MARLAYITPRSSPTGGDTLCLEVPNQPEYRAILRGMFLELTLVESWEQVEGTITAESAAAWAENILQSFEDNAPCQ